MSKAPWKNPTIIFTLLVVFLSGASAGALATRLTLSPERHRISPAWGAEPRKESINRLRRELNLKPEQEREMVSILDDFMTYYQTLQAQMDDVRATGNQRILKLLQDDQKQRFVKMIGELQSKNQIR